MKILYMTANNNPSTPPSTHPTYRHDQVYEERCTTLSKLCAQKAAQSGVKKFIEVSTAQVYKSQGSRPSDESAALKPWTKIAAAKLAAEGEVTRVPGLYSLIVRPSFVYGPADTSAIMPRAVCAAAYVELNEKMKFLWDSSMKINTVHGISDTFFLQAYVL